MGSDRYCALCGVSIDIVPLEIGSGSERAKRIRKELIEAGLRELAGGHDESAERRQSMSDSDLDTEEDRYFIAHRYDPEVMQSRDTDLPNYDRFIRHVRLVIHDPQIKTGSKYFISGSAEVDDFGWGTIQGGHPERLPDEQFEFAMYVVYEDDQTKAFPCHGLCLQILAKIVLGTPDSKLLNPEVLYKAMCDVHDGNNYSLDLDYGYAAGNNEQFWECKPGEEVSGKCLQHRSCIPANESTGTVRRHEPPRVL